MKLKGKVAIVTGAGLGIGKAIAKLFAAEGAKVIVSDYNGDAVTATEKEILAMGNEALAVVADVSKETDIGNLVDQTVKAYGGLDILVNNAGIMDNFEPAGDISDETWERVFAVNTTGVLRTMRKVLPIFLEKGSGSIVNISSIGGLYGARAGAAYTASKHAVIGLSKNTAFMYALNGIRCNCITPGAVETSIAASMTDINQFGMERTRHGMAINPRIGKPNEIAALALFLASDDASFINGAVVTADGGWTAY